MTEEPVLIFCRDECKRSVPADQIEGSGWEYLNIQRRWRCNVCRLQLEAMRDIGTANEMASGHLLSVAAFPSATITSDGKATGGDDMSQLAQEHQWKGPGPAPAKWFAEDGTLVYRSYSDYCDD